MELSLPAAAAQSAGDLDRPEDETARDPLGTGRRTLALRLAQRGRLRELRAERLARLRSGSAPAIRSEAAPPTALPEQPRPRAATPVPPAPVAAQPLPMVARPPAAAPAAVRPPVPLTPRKAAEEDAVAALEEFLRALTGGLGEAAPTDWGLPAAAAPGPAAVLPFQRRDPETAPETGIDAPAAAPLPTTGTAPASPASRDDDPPTLALEAAPKPMQAMDPEPAGRPGSGAPAEARPDPIPPAVATASDDAPPAIPAAASPASGLAQLPGAGPGLLWALDRAGISGISDLAGLAPEALAERLGPIGRLIPAARWIEAARSPDLPTG